MVYCSVIQDGTGQCSSKGRYRAGGAEWNIAL